MYAIVNRCIIFYVLYAFHTFFILKCKTFGVIEYNANQLIH
jgi:hypothetical protein